MHFGAAWTCFLVSLSAMPENLSGCGCLSSEAAQAACCLGLEFLYFPLLSLLGVGDGSPRCLQLVTTQMLCRRHPHRSPCGHGWNFGIYILRSGTRAHLSVRWLRRAWQLSRTGSCLPPSSATLAVPSFPNFPVGQAQSGKLPLWWAFVGLPVTFGTSSPIETTTVIPPICGRLLPGPLQMPKCTDFQVPYIKWCKFWMLPTHILLYTSSLFLSILLWYNWYTGGFFTSWATRESHNWYTALETFGGFSGGQ